MILEITITIRYLRDLRNKAQVIFYVIKESISPDERSCRRSYGLRRNELSESEKIYRKKWTHK